MLLHTVTQLPYTMANFTLMRSSFFVTDSDMRLLISLFFPITSPQSHLKTVFFALRWFGNKKYSSSFFFGCTSNEIVYVEPNLSSIGESEKKSITSLYLLNSPFSKRCTSFASQASFRSLFIFL